MLKRFVKTVFTALLAVVFDSAFAAPILSIQPSELTVQSGQTFTLDVAISDVADLYAFEFSLGFNSALLAVNAINEGHFLATGGSTFFIEGEIDNATGAILWTANALFGEVLGVDGGGTLAQVSFTALAEGISSISLFGVTLLDSAFSGMDFTIQNGSVAIEDSTDPGGGGAVVPEPSLLPAIILCGGLFWFYRKRDARIE